MELFLTNKVKHKFMHNDENERYYHQKRHRELTSPEIRFSRIMPAVARHRTTEENVIGGIARGWSYFSYAIRQLLIFSPCLWAGYKRGRRKERRIKKLRKEGSRVKQPGGSAIRWIRSSQLDGELEMLWIRIEIRED